MQDNKWTLAETAQATGLKILSIRQAAYRFQIPIIGNPNRAAHGAVKQAVLEALVGRETSKQLQVRTGFKKSSITSACKNLMIKLIKKGQQS
jgi:hypothetical protein